MTGKIQPATSIHLDCHIVHIVHVSSPIYLDYHFFYIYAYALLFIQNLNVIRAFYDMLVFICSSLHV